MKLCICRDVSDKAFRQHLLSGGRKIDCAEAALAQCCGSPTNCGQCLEMADEIVFAHNRRVDTVRELQMMTSPQKAREEA